MNKKIATIKYDIDVAGRVLEVITFPDGNVQDTRGLATSAVRKLITEAGVTHVLVDASGTGFPIPPYEVTVAKYMDELDVAEKYAAALIAMKN